MTIDVNGLICDNVINLHLTNYMIIYYDYIIETNVLTDIFRDKQTFNYRNKRLTDIFRDKQTFNN